MPPSLSRRRTAALGALLVAASTLPPRAVVGGAVGVGVAASPYPHVHPRGALRVGLAVVFTAEALALAVVPSVRRGIDGWPYLMGIVVVFWLTFPFAE